MQFRRSPRGSAAKLTLLCGPRKDPSRASSKVAPRLLYRLAATLGCHSGRPTTLSPNRRGRTGVPARHVRALSLPALALLHSAYSGPLFRVFRAMLTV